MLHLESLAATEGSKTPALGQSSVGTVDAAVDQELEGDLDAIDSSMVLRESRPAARISSTPHLTIVIGQAHAIADLIDIAKNWCFRNHDHQSTALGL